MCFMRKTSSRASKSHPRTHSRHSRRDVLEDSREASSSTSKRSHPPKLEVRNSHRDPNRRAFPGPHHTIPQCGDQKSPRFDKSTRWASVVLGCWCCEEKSNFFTNLSTTPKIQSTENTKSRERPSSSHDCLGTISMEQPSSNQSTRNRTTS